jgi:hypothetical protein
VLILNLIDDAIKDIIDIREDIRAINGIIIWPREIFYRSLQPSLPLLPATITALFRPNL